MPTVNLRFPGQYFDTETSTYYNWYRYYDPRSDRYLVSDPIGLHSGLNTYVYARSNPFYWIDRTGLINLKTPGAVGEISIHANPGPDATDYRPEHVPPHVHMGGNDGPRVDFENYEPLSDRDDKALT